MTVLIGGCRRRLPFLNQVMFGSGIPDAWQVRLKLLVEGTVTCRGRSREKVGDAGSVIVEEILIV